MELGAAGAIAAVACFAARHTAEIGRAYAAGDTARAGAVQELVARLHRTIVGELGVPGIKAAVDAVGLAGGPPRPPIPPLADKERARVRALLKEAKLVAA